MGETIKRCKNCGTLFNSYGENFCIECVDELDDIFNKVQDYVYDHENASVVEIAKALDVDGKIILSFIRDGSLELGEGICALQCSRCGAAISSGDFCDECKNKLGKLFDSAKHMEEQPKEEKKKGPRMHVRRK